MQHDVELNQTLLSRALRAAGEQEYLLPLGVFGCWQSFQKVLARRRFQSRLHAENTFIAYVQTSVHHAIAKDLKHRAALGLIEAGDADEIRNEADADQPPSGDPAAPEGEEIAPWRAGVGDAETERLIDFARRIDALKIEQTAGVCPKQARNRLRTCAEKIEKLKAEQEQSLFPDGPVDYLSVLEGSLSGKKRNSGRPRKDRQASEPQEPRQSDLFNGLDGGGGRE